MNSLSMDGMAKLNIHDRQYILGDPPSEAGLSLLKVLIQESHLDSNATSSIIKETLPQLKSDEDDAYFVRRRRLLIAVMKMNDS